MRVPTCGLNCFTTPTQRDFVFQSYLDFFFLKKKGRSKRVDGICAITLGIHLGGMSCGEAFR